MGDYTEYAVTFISGELSEYRSFETAADAERCVQALRPLLHHPPLYALEQFTLYLPGLVTRSWPGMPPGLRPNDYDGLRPELQE